jgi:PAS domain S-box-containing protein
MTDKEDLERELDEVKRRFRSLMDNCVDAMIIINEDGTILDFNPAAEDIFQYTGEETVGQNVSMLMPEPDAALKAAAVPARPISRKRSQ